MKSLEINQKKTFTMRTVLLFFFPFDILHPYEGLRKGDSKNLSGL